ncbi:hypothetical protein CRYUN_Cryun30bG0086000 [Craigia yunnanensis]
MYFDKKRWASRTSSFDKLMVTLKKLSYGLSKDHCDPVLVAQKLYPMVYDGVTTPQFAELVAEAAAALTANHPDYALLAARIAVSKLHKSTKKSFSETVQIMYNYVSKKSGKVAPLIADDVMK